MSTHPPPLLLGPDDVRGRCSPAQAADAVEQALREGLDPALDIPRATAPKRSAPPTRCRRPSAPTGPSTSRLRSATLAERLSPSALREAGDVVLAVEEGAFDRSAFVPMRDVITGAADVPLDRPLLFKSVGMSWEDLVVAAAVVDADPARDSTSFGRSEPC